MEKTGTNMKAERIERLERYLLEDPDNPFNHYALAMELAHDNPVRMRALLQKLLLDHAGYLPTYYQLALILWENDELEQALDLFDRGILLAQQQNDVKALSELKRARQNLVLEM